MLLLTACNPSLLAEQIALVAPESMAEEDASTNKLLVMGSNGNIYTLNPDGANRKAITRDAGMETQYRQPTWSPNGERIAFTTIRSEDGDVKSFISTIRADGDEQIDLEVPFAPFYIYWSPDSRRLAYLSNWNRSENLPGMALRLVEIEEGTAGAPTLRANTLAEGQPFYFSWSPDGSRLLTHIGNERLEVQGVDGTQEALLMSTGAFPAPIWSKSGEQLVFALNDEQRGEQQLVLSDIAGKPISDITDFSDRISFTLSPDGAKVAYVITEDGEGGATFGPLYVFDLATMATRELSSAPVIAFFWSPDGNKLAFMEAELIRNRVQLRWQVWDGTRKTAYEAFLPTTRFYQNYLSFFDQYAQSMTIWSPDSSAFTYAGVNSQGARGIWVQELGEESADLVSTGIFSAWSPK
jgi:TolB protein